MDYKPDIIVNIYIYKGGYRSGAGFQAQMRNVYFFPGSRAALGPLNG
jgi:hypothetical protein